MAPDGCFWAGVNSLQCSSGGSGGCGGRRGRYDAGLGGCCNNARSGVQASPALCSVGFLYLVGVYRFFSRVLYAEIRRHYYCSVSRYRIVFRQLGKKEGQWDNHSSPICSSWVVSPMLRPSSQIFCKDHTHFLKSQMVWQDLRKIGCFGSSTKL